MAQPKIKWNGFVTCNLSADDKKELAQLLGDTDLAATFDDLASITEEGFAFSLKPPTEKTQSFAASFRGIDPESKNAGWMLTGWGADPTAAMICLLYKHTVLLRGDYSGGGIADDTDADMFG